MGEILTIPGCEPTFARDGDKALKLYRKAREAGRPFAAVIMRGQAGVTNIPVGCTHPTRLL